MWPKKDLAAKRKLRYYKEVINPTLEDQKKINITKIRMNFHELHSEIDRWVVPKMPWMERIYRICENRNIEDENHFLLEYPSTATLDLSFTIFVTILTFLAFYNVKIIVSLGSFSPSFLSIGIKS